VCKARSPSCASCVISDLCEHPGRKKIIAAADKP